jgi:hypothetical protein
MFEVGLGDLAGNGGTPNATRGGGITHTINLAPFDGRFGVRD